MQTLHDYILKHAKRGACTCGQCVDAPDKPSDHQPTGHTADMIFFKVKAIGDPKPEELRKLLKAHEGPPDEVYLFDGKEHNYMEIGGWMGDQGMALMLMGLGSLLGLWTLLTPRTVLGNDLDSDLVMRMAGMGMVSVQAQAQK